MVTFSVWFGIGGFDRFMDGVRREGVEVCPNVTDGIATGVWVPRYDLYVARPTYECWGYGRAWFEPTPERLSLFQRLCLYLTHGNIVTLRNDVKLCSAELAYDFYVPDAGYAVHAGIAKRLLHRLWPRHGQSLYTVSISRGLDDNWNLPEFHGNTRFWSFEEALEHYGLCRDGAINGDYTGYLQSCRRDDRHRSSESLDLNAQASKHTKIYPKKIAERWRVRIEATLKKAVLKKCLPLDHTHFAGLLGSVHIKVYRFLGKI